MESSKPQSVGEPDAIQRAIEYGVDITLLKENLRRTPAERIEYLESVIAFLQEVRRAGQLMRRANVERSKDSD